MKLIGRTRELIQLRTRRSLCFRTIASARSKRFTRLLDEARSPSLLIGLIAGNYHRLALGKYLLTKGGREEVFRNISMPPFKRDSYISTLQRSDARKIRARPSTHRRGRPRHQDVTGDSSSSARDAGLRAIWLIT
jgi:hypothetical protein